ncbi:branched-chain amino acid transport system substrate-binding protein [Constrictibacter sp. MBR-5]|jgi:branched-chain amino acid transport system substrate-binding protein|uniref:ABC transporter substrate-binding protein n=1 Tax=Constrictibacter sp. MBR-5 TaxID=3156467 RepID=UPI00339856BD
MHGTRSIRRIAAAAVAAVLLPLAGGAAAQDKVIKIGVIYDYSGPYAAGGSETHAWGTKLAIDMVNARGGTEGYRIQPTYADAQSKTDVAINEAERMLTQTGVDMIMGVFSSAHCVPLATKVDTAKKFFWINTCISPAVLKDRHLRYVFRPQVHGGQFGEMSPDMLAEFSQSKLGMDKKHLKVAIIHEDGPYGVGVAEGNDRAARRHGMQVVLKEGYAATSPDLSSLITKLKRARPDVILHTGYNPDITLFLRQGREQGLRFKVLIGHGAGYGEVDRLYAAFGNDVDHIFDVDSVAATLLDPAKMAPEIAEVTNLLEKAYLAANPSAKQLTLHASIGFGHTWAFLNDVLPRAIRNHGGITPDALRQAALETDIPDGGTTQGYGIRFNPPEHEMAGQNNRAFPVIIQYIGGDMKLVWPPHVAPHEPVLPLPAKSPYAMR